MDARLLLESDLVAVSEQLDYIECNTVKRATDSFQYFD